MRQWKTRLRQNKEGINNVTRKEENDWVQVYEWRPANTIIPVASDEAKIEMNNNQVKIIDSGGHIEYTLSTSFSIFLYTYLTTFFNPP